MSFQTTYCGAARATKSIVNAYSVAGFTAQTIITAPASTGIKSVNSGALTANTLATVLSLTGGAYEIPQFTIETLDATARTLRAVVTVDGEVVFDYKSASISAAARGVCLAGTNHYQYMLLQRPIICDDSILIQSESNLTETDKFLINYNYHKVG